MTRSAALLDAALTVQRWQRQFAPWLHWRVTHYLAQRLGCYPAWTAIETEIVRRLLDESNAARRAA